jgi:hypothetical protein
VNGDRHAKEVVDGKIESAMTFCECLERYVYPDIKEKMFWLQNHLSWFVIDGASCHTAFRIHDNPSVYDRISKFGTTGEIRVDRNPPRSPGMMILDLGLNKSLESQVLHEPMVADAIALIKLVSKTFWEYESDKLLVMWGVLAEVYRQVLAYKGGNANAPHSHVRQRLHNNQEVINLSVNMVDYHACRRKIDRYYDENEVVENEDDDDEFGAPFPDLYLGAEA